ncbi:multi-sensor hybrid histidine kinase [Nostoc sp. NIES-2111]|nr:multi-sensor hybrid histidine kinase [Nostoc sp. NIES-2111]
MLKFKRQIGNYAVAIASVVIAAMLMLALNPYIQLTQASFLLFFGAVTISAWYAGRDSGLLATFLSAFCAKYFFLDPVWSLNVTFASGARMALFVLQGCLVSVLVGSLRTSQQQSRESLKQLQETQARLRRLVDSNIIGVLSCDIYGAIHEANDEFLRMTGFSQEDVLAGRVRWDQMTPPDLRDRDAPALEELLTTGKHTGYEKAFLGKDGRRVPVIVGAALMQNHPESVIAFVLDLSKRKRAEQRLALQYAVAQVLAQAVTLTDAIPLVLQSLCESLDYQIGSFWRVDPKTNVMRYVDSWYPADLDMTGLITTNQVITFAPGVGLPGRIWESGESAWITNIAQDSNFPRAAIAFDLGLHSVFGFPVSLGQEILGVIECFSTRYQAPDEDLLHMMRALGSQIGQFMERKQAEEELQASQALFESFMNYSPINAFMKDESGQYIYVNPCVERSFNLPLAQWLNKTDFDLLPQATAQAIRENDLAVLQAGQVVQFMESAPLSDGEHDYLSFKFPLKDVEGRPLLAGMSVDITERKRFEAEREQLLQKLEASLGQLEAVINNMTEGLVIADAQGYIIEFNPAALALHGYASLEQVRQQLPEFTDCFAAHDLQGNLLSVAEWPLARVLRGETFFDWEIQVKRLDIGKTWIGSYSGTPVRNKHGQIILALVTCHDVTEQRQAQAELARSLEAEQAARADAEVANRIKDEFLAVLSHELRTPLSPILGWSKLLQSGKLDEAKTAQALSVIERNANLQSQLIEDLLDISRILQGKLALNVVAVDLATIIESAMETVRLAAQAKSIQIHYTLEPVGQVSGDPARLQQVVWNLLSNAVKFTPEGGRVDVRLEQHNSFARIIVTDTGKGIRADFLPHVFDYFRQADATTTRKFGGLGLGLAIVRYLVELHGGMVEVESLGEGQGATFTVWLPLLSNQFQAGQNQQSSQSSMNLSGVKVLIVDDDRDTREFLAFVLAEAEATVLLAANASEAYSALISNQPDVLISDIGMPDMDGYMLMRQVRALPPEQGGQIPAIALTAYAGEINQQQALKVGFQQHISKPVDPDILIAAIASLTQRN